MSLIKPKLTLGRIIALTLMVSAAASVYAAGGSERNQESPAGTSSAGTPVNAPAGSSVTITDVLGRRVTLEKPAKRIAGTHNPTMNIAVILGGGGSYIVGFGSKNMSGGLYGYVFPELEPLTQIGSGSNINFETVMQVNPDLAILPERNAGLAGQFEALGIPAAVILPNEESFESIKNSIALLGALIGENERAARINTFFDSKINAAKAIARGITAKPRVISLGASSQLSVANGAMLQSVMIETAGAENVAKDVPGSGGYITVSIEEIIRWNPEVIYIPAFARYSINDLLNDPAWSSISAIRNRKVFSFPGDLEPWDTPTPSTAMGVTWLLNNLYPHLYSMDQVLADAAEYYQLVYGRSFSAEQLGLR